MPEFYRRATVNLILPAGRRGHELMRYVPAHETRIRRNGHVLHPASGEDPAIHLVHSLIDTLQGLIVQIKTVGVFHYELFRAKDAETRPGFIPEFRLYLVEYHRQIAVAPYIFCYEIRYHLFVRRAEHIDLSRSVLISDHDLLEEFKPAGLFPYLGRLHGWEEHFLRPGIIHLFSDNILDLPQYLKPQRQIRISA